MLTSRFWSKAEYFTDFWRFSFCEPFWEVQNLVKLEGQYRQWYMAWLIGNALQRKTNVCSWNICNKILGQVKLRDLTIEKVRGTSVNKRCFGKYPDNRKHALCKIKRHKTRLFPNIPGSEERKILLCGIEAYFSWISSYFWIILTFNVETGESKFE